MTLVKALNEDLKPALTGRRQDVGSLGMACCLPGWESREDAMGRGCRAYSQASQGETAQ